MSPFWWNVVWFFCGAGSALAVAMLVAWALFYFFTRDLEAAESDRYGGSR